jgi:hypothetical protein
LQFQAANSTFYSYYSYFSVAAGVGTYMLNILVIGTLVARQRYVNARTAVA